MSASSNRFALLDSETTGSGSDRGSSVVSAQHSSPLREIPIINLKLDRESGNGDPQNPPFLSHFPTIRTPQTLQNFILPYIASCFFVLDSQLDINYFAKIINLLGAAPYITQIAFSGFYWFSGVRDNRRSNPALMFAAQLPYLADVTLIFHTAGLTESCYGERDRIRMESINLEQSKSLRCIRLNDVIDFYDMRRLLECNNLQVLRLDLIKSSIVERYCQQGDPASTYRDLIHWCRQNLFEKLGRPVTIDAKINGEMPGY
ncbi:hypothetical protein BDV96DRAFT_672824 [Lophiotrema nucula]|uniref:Uncharacterized protein n=1 Tax=Lophiotrema nucula TaxID=690887 RepID=A0A6A5YLV4_9PLEO|nr:hypothetical protein BDV96DRAFT_672824 [Lophiotrema nucula]